MASHQQYKNFVKKYNSEFGFRGYSKLKKQELINKIESVLNKSRKEIKDEYKKLKEMKKEVKPKKTPAPKPKPKPKPKTDSNKIIYNERTLQSMLPQLIGASIASDQKIYTKDELTNAYQVAEKVLTAFQGREWRNAYDEKYKKPKPSPVKKPAPPPSKKGLYNSMFAFMVGDARKDVKYSKSELKDAFNNVGKHLKGDQLSEWKRVYNKTITKPAQKPTPITKPAQKPTPITKQAQKPTQDEKVFTGSNSKLIKILKDDFKQKNTITKFFDKENKDASFYVGTLNKITQKGNKLLLDTKEGVKRTLLLETGKKTGKSIEDESKLLEPVYKQVTKFIDDLKTDKSKITVAKLDKFYKDNKYILPSDKKISSYDIVDNNRDLDFENIFVGGSSVFLPFDIKKLLLKRFPSKSKIIKDKFIMENLYYFLFADPRKLTTFIKEFYTFDNKIKNNLDKLTQSDTEFINDYLRFRSYLITQKPFIVYNKFINDKLKKADYKFNAGDNNIMSIMNRVKN